MKIIKYTNVLNIIINNLNPDINPKIRNLMNINGMLLSIATTLINNKIDTIEKVNNLEESKLYSYILQSKNLNDFNDFDSKLISGKSLGGIQEDYNINYKERTKLIKKSSSELFNNLKQNKGNNNLNGYDIINVNYIDSFSED